MWAHSSRQNPFMSQNDPHHTVGTALDIIKVAAAHVPYRPLSSLRIHLLITAELAVFGLLLNWDLKPVSTGSFGLNWTHREKTATQGQRQTAYKDGGHESFISPSPSVFHFSNTSLSNSQFTVRRLN